MPTYMRNVQKLHTSSNTSAHWRIRYVENKFLGNGDNPSQQSSTLNFWEHTSSSFGPTDGPGACTSRVLPILIFYVRWKYVLIKKSRRNSSFFFGVISGNVQTGGAGNGNSGTSTKGTVALIMPCDLKFYIFKRFIPKLPAAQSWHFCALFLSF